MKLNCLLEKQRSRAALNNQLDFSEVAFLNFQANCRKAVFSIVILFFWFVILFIFAVLPRGCGNYRGPHSIQCMESLWRQAGCLPEGIYPPAKYTQADLATYSLMNLA